MILCSLPIQCVYWYFLTDPDPAGQPLALVVYKVTDDQVRPLAAVEDLITEDQYRGSRVVQYRRWLRSVVNNALGVKAAKYVQCIKYRPLTRDDYHVYDIARPAQLAQDEVSEVSEDDYSFLDEEDNSRDHAYMEAVKRLMNDMAKEQQTAAHPNKESAEVLNQLRKDLLAVASKTQQKKARVLTPNELAVQKAAKDLERAKRALESSQGASRNGQGVREDNVQQQSGLGGPTHRSGGGRDGYDQPSNGSGGQGRRGNDDENRNFVPPELEATLPGEAVLQTRPVRTPAHRTQSRGSPGSLRRRRRLAELILPPVMSCSQTGTARKACVATGRPPSPRRSFTSANVNTT